MRIDLRNLDTSGGTVTGTDVVEYTDDGGQTTTLSCAVTVHYRHAGAAYYFDVEVSAPMETSCHRCLDRVSHPVRTEFDLVARRRSERGEDTGEVPADDNHIILGAKESEVSLHPYIHEAVVVGIPILILCNDECKGLCPECGANRNHGKCTCRPAVDPRWNDLRGLAGD